MTFDPLRPVVFEIIDVIVEAPGVFTHIYRPTGRQGLAPSRPGQFNMVTAFGVGEVPISVSGHPAALAHTVRVAGSVTRAMSKLRVGERVGLRGPFGVPWPLEQAQGGDLVIVAGGIGLAPLRSAVRHGLANRAEYRRLILLYGARSPTDLLYADELAEWRARFDFEVAVTVDRAGSDWHGEVGMVTNLIQRAGFDPATSTALVCGPEAMMRFVAQSLVDRGISEERVFLSVERNMKCAVGWCGHCQFGPEFVCRTGPVFPYPRVADLLAVKEL